MFGVVILIQLAQLYQMILVQPEQLCSIYQKINTSITNTTPQFYNLKDPYLVYKNQMNEVTCV